MRTATRRPPVVLVHGAAVGPAMWERVEAELRRRAPGVIVDAVSRPRTGDLGRECDWLAERARGAFLIGISGGATLGLALTSRPAPFVGALLHEPAAGSLAPGLLAPVAAAFAAQGPDGFGRALYGPSWDAAMLPAAANLAAEFAMFRGFEPQQPQCDPARATLSVGALSPPARHDSVRALSDRFGYPIRTVPGARHFAPWDAPDAFAALALELIDALAQ